MDPKDKLPAEWPEFDVEDMLRRLTAAGVDFVVVGGIAMMLLGSARLTRDLDICFGPDDDNVEALGRVLVELEARLRGVDEEVPFIADAATLRDVQLLTLTTSKGWLDVHRTLEGAPRYETLRRNAERYDIGGLSVLVASPDDMIAMKEVAGRSIDMVDIEELKAIKRLRRRMKRR